MSVTTVLVQRAYLIGNLDQRVGNAAQRALGGASLHPDLQRDLTFLQESGHPAGMLAARLDSSGAILTAAVVSQDAAPLSLTATQRAALAGVTADGAMHSLTVPGLGTYRVAVLQRDGVRVLAGLPMGDVQDMIGGLVAVEVGVTAAGLALAGGLCAVVIRRQLRPLGRVAATAVEVSRSPLGRGVVTGLTRVPERDTDPGSEAGQVGAALNRMIDHVESSLAERQRGEEQVRRSEERMRRFLADASHELRTPLASIAGYAELMNRGTDRIEPLMAWRRVSAESARMTGLVEDLLLLARLDEGRPLESGEVDLAAVVAEAVWDARVAGDGHEWRLGLELDGGIPLVVGDGARLHQVVANLLANARVHTPVGTTVVAEVGVVGERCVVRVRDDGPGIPDALLPTVFERFTRGDASRARARSGGRAGAGSGGAGLGLAIVSAIVGAHGGRIGVSSVPGRTEFTLELPVAAGAGAGAAAVGGGGSAASAAAGEGAASAGGGAAAAGGGSGACGHGESAASRAPLSAATAELDW
ncbi:ATP-binding protein [Streptomyces sp. NPDC091279]|uniref:HAMP domain-containing sensor histidine kinase n=1 Tax=Streptomyces sp. NPDC091279 TaxID=3365983 RepID=UPI00382C8D1C